LPGTLPLPLLVFSPKLASRLISLRLRFTNLFFWPSLPRVDFPFCRCPNSPLFGKVRSPSHDIPASSPIYPFLLFPLERLNVKVPFHFVSHVQFACQNPLIQLLPFFSVACVRPRSDCFEPVFHVFSCQCRSESFCSPPLVVFSFLLGAFFFRYQFSSLP